MAKRAFKVEAYDQKYNRLVNLLTKKVESAHKSMVNMAAHIAKTTGWDGKGEFYLKNFPTASKKIDDLLHVFAADVTDAISEGQTTAWQISEAKNAAIVADIAKRARLTNSQVSAWTPRNVDALAAFKSRTIKGMNLSERVWDFVRNDKMNFELAMELGLAEGRSAAELSRDIRNYLREPKKLFRRVRDRDGRLRLSKAAQEYHPGRGVYRSSYKNAFRMTMTETNMAYHAADMESYKDMPFVVGYEVKLSKMHDVRDTQGQPYPNGFADMCDELAGVYPKEFVFTGWHPHCRCYVVAKMASDEEIDKFARLTDDEQAAYKWRDKVEEMPECYDAYMERNAERIAGRNSTPYFIGQNYVDGDPSKGLIFMQRVGADGKKTPVIAQIIPPDTPADLQIPTEIPTFEIPTAFEPTRENAEIHLNACRRLLGAESDDFDWLQSLYDAGQYDYVIGGAHSHIYGKYGETIEILNRIAADAKSGKLDFIPNAYRERFAEIVAELRQAVDANTGLLGTNGGKSILEADNIIKLSKNKHVQKFGFEKVSTKMPENLFSDAFRKIGVDYTKTPINKDFFDFMDEFIPLELKGAEGCCFTPTRRRVFIPLSRKATKERLKIGGWAEKIIYHEFGHASDYVCAAGKWRKSEEMRSIIRKHFYMREKAGELQTKFYEYAMKHGIRVDTPDGELLGGVSDTLQALLDGHPYVWKYGHGVLYWEEDKIAAEIIAHACENYWSGNKHFKAMFPELHADLAKFMESRYAEKIAAKKVKEAAEETWRDRLKAAAKKRHAERPADYAEKVRLRLFERNATNAKTFDELKKAREMYGGELTIGERRNMAREIWAKNRQRIAKINRADDYADVIRDEYQRTRLKYQLTETRANVLLQKVKNVEGVDENLVARLKAEYGHPRRLQKACEDLQSAIVAAEKASAEKAAREAAEKAAKLAKSAGADEARKAAQKARETIAKCKKIDDAVAEFRKLFPELLVDFEGFTKSHIEVVAELAASLSYHKTQFPQIMQKIHFFGSVKGQYEILVRHKTIELLKDPRYSFAIKNREDAERYAKTIARVKDRSPRANSNAYAYSDRWDGDGAGTNGICWNGKRNYQKALECLEDDVKDKFHPIGTDKPRAIIDHELGHKIDELLDLRTDSEFLAIYDDVASKGRQYMTDVLSGYAWSGRNSKAEFIAEAWSEFLCNPQPREIAQKVGELILRKYKEKFPKP